MPPSPSFASTAVRPATGPAAGDRAERESPTCPVCARASEATPDLYGVVRCLDCALEFRPPGRVPVRRAGVSASPNPGSSQGWIGLLAVGAMIIAVTMAVGDSRAPTEPPPFQAPTFEFEPSEITVPILDPALLGGLELGESMVVRLEHEVHISQINQADVFLTGLVRNPSSGFVDIIDVEVRCLSSTGALLETRTGTSACQHMGPGELCAWTLDARVPKVGGFEIEARAHFSLPDEGSVELSARFDGAGQRIATPGVGDPIELDLTGRRVSFELGPGLSAVGLQGTVVSFDGEGQVRAVERTSWEGVVRGGQEQTRALTISVGEEIEVYELRIASPLVVDMAKAEARELDSR